ncbi:MFS transporter [Amycolatopsis granulosa]|uniref:MFS transporter n=1 Tax=Amycolatopsis granulosa TaxID=185684 RepID=UPI001422703A|nr:MFS transporter [Amycolatopsis granulosa]NIH88357.1 metabolite-proton symporter [Amycolatopsis granulosa]
MATADDQQQDSRADAGTRRVVWSSFLGSTLEFYDFFLYGLAAATVLSRQFFPSADPVAGALAAFATFGAGFLARPVGAAVLGSLGDRIGRKRVLIGSLLAMGTATVLIGLLPGYATIGVAAPALLVLARFLQGFSVGGEWAGAALMVLESAPKRRRGLFASSTGVGSMAGMLLATAAFAACSQLPGGAFEDWGWRIPFLLSVAITALALYIRVRISEPEVFAEVQRRDQVARRPVRQLFRTSWPSILRVALMCLAESVPFYLATVWVLSYGPKYLGLDRSSLYVATIVSAGLGFVSLPFFGALSDRIGRRRLYLGAVAATAVVSFPFFWALQSGSVVLIGLAYIVLLNGGHDAISAIQSSYYPELFDVRVRFSGTALSRQIGSMIGGGFAPFIATGLVAWSGGGWLPVALYLVGATLISLVATVMSPETLHKRLDVVESAGSSTGSPV